MRAVGRWLLTDRLGRLLVLAAIIAVGLAIAKAANNGTDSVPTSDTNPTPLHCGIVQSGRKLCGNDLAAYCQEFAVGTTDPNTIEACGLVGVEVK